jgi:hypothetical protein
MSYCKQNVQLYTTILQDYQIFYTYRKINSYIWKCHHCQCRAAKFTPMLGAQGLWAGRNLYRATPAVAWGFGFSGRSHPKSPVLTQKGMRINYSSLDPRGLNVRLALRFFSGGRGLGSKGGGGYHEHSPLGRVLLNNLRLRWNFILLITL